MYKYQVRVSRPSTVKRLSNFFELIGMIVIAIVFLLFMWAAVYGVNKAMSNRCDYYTKVLTPTPEMERVCGN